MYIQSIKRRIIEKIFAKTQQNEQEEIMETPSMIGYIQDQGRALKATFENRAVYCNPFCQIFQERDIRKIYLLGSGTSYNAATAIKQYLEMYLPVEAEVMIPTVFTNHAKINRNCIYNQDEILVVGISQSGTSVSTIEAMKKAKQEGYYTVAITEATESLITREVDRVVKLTCGKEEIPVETRGYSVTLLQGYLTALEVAHSRKKLDDILVEYYKTETDKTITLDEMYWRWRKVQDCMVVDNTVYKYTTDYNRFFKDKAFMQNPIEEITVDMLKLFFHDMIVDNGLSKGSFKKAYGYIDNTFQKAFREKVIPENPMVYLLRKQFYGYCEEIDKPLSKQVYTDEEVELITQWLHQQYKKIPSYIPHYAVELASLTGMRVGEIVALKWEDIHNEKGYFTIQRSEKFNRKTKEYFIDKTKNKKVRNFPLDEKITTLFTRVKKAEFAKGYLCEWIFANEEGRIHAPVVSSCIKNKCKQLKIPDRGIHAFRKTFNSNMRCAGVSEVVAASLLGHSPDVNKNYYTFDTTSLEDKAKIVADAHAHFG